MILDTPVLMEPDEWLGGIPNSKLGYHKETDLRTKKTKWKPHISANDPLRTIHQHAKVEIRRKMKERGFSIIDSAWNGGKGLKYHFMPHVNGSGGYNQYWFATDIKNAYGSVRLDGLAKILCTLFTNNPNPYWDPGGIYYEPKIYGGWRTLFFRGIETLKNPDLPLDEACELVDKMANTYSNFMAFENWKYYAEVQKIFARYPPAVHHKYGQGTMRWYLRKYFSDPEKSDGIGYGLPSSPLLFNVYCSYTLDLSLTRLCKRYGITYTRYGDDMLFSSQMVIGKVKRKKLKKAIRESGMEIKEAKTQYFDIDKLGDSGILLNGLGIRNRKGQAEIFVPSYKKRILKGSLYMAVKHGAEIKEERLRSLMGNFKTFTTYAGRLEPPGSTHEERDIEKLSWEFLEKLKRDRIIEEESNAEQIVETPKEGVQLGLWGSSSV